MPATGDFDRANSDTVVGDVPGMSFWEFHGLQDPVTMQSLLKRASGAYPMSEEQKTYLRALNLMIEDGEPTDIKDPQHVSFKIKKDTASDGKSTLTLTLEHKGKRVGFLPVLCALKPSFSNWNTFNPALEGMAPGTVDKYDARSQPTFKLSVILDSIPDTGSADLNKVFAHHAAAYLNLFWEMYASVLWALMEDPEEEFEGFDPLMEEKRAYFKIVRDSYDPYQAVRQIAFKKRSANHPFQGPVVVKPRDKNHVIGEAENLTLDDIYVSYGIGGHQYLRSEGKGSPAMPIPAKVEDAASEDGACLREFIDRNRVTLKEGMAVFRKLPVSVVTGTKDDKADKKSMSFADQVAMAQDVAGKKAMALISAIIAVSLPGGSAKKPARRMGSAPGERLVGRNLVFGAYSLQMLAENILDAPEGGGGGADLGGFLERARAMAVKEALQGAPRSAEDEEDEDAALAAVDEGAKRADNVHGGEEEEEEEARPAPKKRKGKGRK